MNTTQKAVAAATISEVQGGQVGSGVATGGGTYWGRLPSTRTVRRGISSWVDEYPYSIRHFRRRFRVPRALMLKLAHNLVKFNPDVWVTRWDAAQKRAADRGEGNGLLACSGLWHVSELNRQQGTDGH